MGAASRGGKLSKGRGGKLSKGRVGGGKKKQVTPRLKFNV